MRVKAWVLLNLDKIENGKINIKRKMPSSVSQHSPHKLWFRLEQDILIQYN